MDLAAGAFNFNVELCNSPHGDLGLYVTQTEVLLPMTTYSSGLRGQPAKLLFVSSNLTVVSIQKSFLIFMKK